MAILYYLLLALVYAYCGVMKRVDRVRYWFRRQSRDTAVGLVLAGFFISLTGPVLKAVQLANAGVLA